jgi:PKD repeat protein
MKKIIYFFLPLSIILSSCHKSVETPIPQSSFSVDNVEPEVGQAVFFTNNSVNGYTYEWDFGDGYISNDENPTHVFTSTGTYEVLLTVTSSGGDTDHSSIVITVTVPTLLVIEVREYYSDAIVPGASIILYPSITDWDAQTNSVVEGYTDANGTAVFSNLDPLVYYVDVWEATHDNYQLRAEDIGFVRTPEVLSHTISGFIAYVDIVNHTSGVSRNREMVIRKIGRKTSDKNLIPGFSGSWQELLKRSFSKK